MSFIHTDTPCSCPALKDNWLCEPNVADKTGMLCDINGTFGENGWLSGTHEGEQVVVTNVFVAKEGFTSKVSVKFHQSAEPPPPSIPPNFLRPVQPSKVGQKVLIVLGPRMGSDGVVQDLGTVDSVVTLSGSMLMVDCRNEELCTLVEV